MTLPAFPFARLCSLASSLVLASLLLHGQTAPDASIRKHRVIVLSDIEADPDDTQSLVRLLLYANQIDIQGIVATTSCWQKNQIAPESMKRVIHAYGQVQPNLENHERGFPTEKDLLMRVKDGLPRYGMEGVGNGKDSEGSEWIIKKLEENDERPLWISVWGGVNTLAQALHKIKHTRSGEAAKKLIAKLRVYAISDQDDSGIWIRNNFPDLFYIVSPGDDYGSATWSAINTAVNAIDNRTISNAWLAAHIQQRHGPLGASYPDVAYGMEGDTPAFLSLIPNGLTDPEHPEWGGWGGRYELLQPAFDKRQKGSSGVPHEPETRKIWTNVSDTYVPFATGDYGRAVRKDTIVFSGNKVTLWRWRDDFQHDFAARMDWCLRSYQEANHPPVPTLMHADKITVQSGQGFSLDASGSYDPDGDHLSFVWFHYREAGSYPGTIDVGTENLARHWLVAPEVKQQETAHFILKVTDKGTPALSRYRRVIVTIRPR